MLYLLLDKNKTRLPLKMVKNLEELLKDINENFENDQKNSKFKLTYKNEGTEYKLAS
jgi:hypothetical protein